MRAITRGAEPQALRQFINDNQTSPQNLHYDNTGTQEKDPMLEQLVRGQHGLCAYTMRRVVHADGRFNAHIEHILPRTAHPDESLSWTNLLACFPRTGDCDFGAKPKAAYDPATQPFVRPDRMVDGHFRFCQNGEVEGLTDAALACIAPKVLNLNAKELVNDRKAKIQGALNRRPSAAQARRRAQALRQPDTQGWLEPYCEAVAQALEAYALRLGNTAKRLKGSR